MAKEKKFTAKSKEWSKKNNIKGPQAFLRFVMYNLMECLSQQTDDIVFKGGNLLWLYIKTPRQTIDLDFVTTSIDNKNDLVKILEKTFRVCDDRGLKLSIKRYTSIEKGKINGANLVIRYETTEGASNSFELDVIFKLESHTQKIRSPLNENVFINAASIENIICDKLSAMHRFAGGNTRLKDFDDLWRISESSVDINTRLLKNALKDRDIAPQLDFEWINKDMAQGWKRHSGRYSDLPKELVLVFENINKFLNQI